MRRLKPLDAAWLYVESSNSPMHVAGLQILSPPKGAKAGFLNDIVARFKEGSGKMVPPWNLRLVQSPLSGVLPAWEVDRNVDLDYHMRHSALPQPGGERELGVLVSRLHSHPLDLQRPLWECHLIEGLEGGRFALYTKMHHALMDGMAGMRMIQRAMSESPRNRSLSPPWALGRLKPREEEPRAASLSRRMNALYEAARRQASTLPEVARAMAKIWHTGKDADPGLVAPFSAPKSVLNQRITAPRRFATQQYELERLRRLARQADVTLNDIVLALCSGALRRFLQESGALPRRPLTAGLPVSVRPQGDDTLGTAISFILANLATDVADPRERLAAIRASTQRSKEHLQRLPKSSLDNYTAAFMAPFVLALVTGLGGRGRPMFNVTISNVPGPEKPLYFAGARLEAMYPISLLTHGQALNITCVSYAGTLNFGYTGCRDTLPHMQHIAVYTGEALEELERVFAGR
ncbi:MAG: wax ester/triacylglycerol synthase family O-acyltransferase [Nevskia sp.]|nr:wax ester/triacylglycerol synthase family O-acyltransferase [Nevskia sp.]